MGISISGPSTQIPTNVVEVGNEITQNQLNAITASNTPSTGNPMQTLSAMQNWLSSNVWPTINQKLISPIYTWPHPFPMTGDFVLVYRPDSNTWWPWNTAGTVIHSVAGGTFQGSYNFDFNDWYGNTQSLNNSYVDVGTSNTVYTTLGQWINGTSWQTYSTNTYYPANGPAYSGNWDNPVAVSNQFYDGSNYTYRYVYREWNGTFYTADNMNNPPY